MEEHKIRGPLSLEGFSRLPILACLPIDSHRFPDMGMPADPRVPYGA
jgi:hypothetical protein